MTIVWTYSCTTKHSHNETCSEMGEKKEKEKKKPIQIPNYEFEVMIMIIAHAWIIIMCHKKSAMIDAPENTGIGSAVYIIMTTVMKTVHCGHDYIYSTTNLNMFWCINLLKCWAALLT